MKQLWKEIRVLFTGWELIFQLAFLFLLNYGLCNILIDNKILSLTVGLSGMLFFFIVFSYQNKKLKKYQQTLSDILKYVLNMSFFLKTGENVLNSLISSSKMASPTLSKDIDLTVKKLKDEAKLDTEHFSKYDFPALNQYHDILNIKYEHGGDPDQMFNGVIKNISFELKSRDKLYRDRKELARNIYQMLIIVYFMMYFLRFKVTPLWDIFIGYGYLGIGLVIGLYISTLIYLFFLQRKNLDISVRL